MILNLTQHPGAPEQGVAEPADKAVVAKLLTFEQLPSSDEISKRARALAELAKASEEVAVMIGGAPFYMSALETALKTEGIRPLYAFSLRESAETVQADGSIRKTQVFRHVGFVEV